MHRRTIALAMALLAVSACKKTGEDEYEVKTPAVGFTTDTVTVRKPDIEVGRKVDTVTVPTVEMKRETVVIDKPVLGKEKRAVEAPTVEVKRP